MVQQSPLTEIDWDDLRYFLALARQGSLSGAARALHTTQPTMGRRLVALEQRLATQLFQRMPLGLVLTEAGHAILAHAAAMEEEALAASRLIAGRTAGLSGRIRMTTTEWIGRHILSPLVAQFCSRHPDVTIEMTVDANLLNIARRDADIAIRMQRFDQENIVQRKVADAPFDLFASPSYLARARQPDFERRGVGSALVLPEQALGGMLGEAAWVQRHLGEAKVAFRSDSRECQGAVAAAGAGLVVLPTFLGANWPGLVSVAAPEPVPGKEVWLGLHGDSRHILRVRALADHLSADLQHLRPLKAVDPVAGGKEAQSGETGALVVALPD
jgi:DNA-binding transcriptional LysR family regulator